MVMIVELPPDTGAIMPDSRQLKSLRKIVAAAHPWIDGVTDDTDQAEREFSNAFWSVAQLFRTEKPDDKRGFGAILNDANASLDESISGGMFLAACIAAGDVIWRRGDGSVGEVLAVGLSPYSGRRANNHWMAIASGTGNLLAPLPPREEYVRSARAHGQTTIWR